MKWHRCVSEYRAVHALSDKQDVGDAAEPAGTYTAIVMQPLKRCMTSL